MIPKYWLTRTEDNRTRIEMQHCPFCQADLDIDGSWLVCGSCRVDFVFHIEGGFHIKFDRNIGKWIAALNLYPEANKTVLTAFNRDHNDPLDNGGYSEIEIPHCMTNITPDNVVEKIKLIMVWQ